jgi:hypothetical protein
MKKIKSKNQILQIEVLLRNAYLQLKSSGILAWHQNLPHEI